MAESCWAYLPAEECREGVILEAQSIVGQVVRVSQDVFLGQPGEVIEFYAPLRGPDRDEKHFHAFVLELGQDIAVQLPCKLLQVPIPYQQLLKFLKELSKASHHLQKLRRP